MKLQKFIFFLVVFLITVSSIFVRLYHLPSNPPSLFSDEVDAGYQALTFNRCFGDYFGNIVPIHFHSYSDWRTSLYIYTVALTQNIFGTTEFSVRFPAAFYGVGVSLIFSLLMYLLSRKKIIFIFSLLISSISPWLIHFSRSGFEVTGMLVCFLVGYLLWFKFIQNKKTSFLIFSLFFLSLTVYFYSTAKMYLGFVLLLLITLSFKQIISIPRRTKLVALAFLFIFLLPMAADTFRGYSGYRFSYISIFSDPTVSKNVDYQHYLDILISQPDQIGITPSTSSKFVHNRLQSYIGTFAANYISSFSTNFLWLKGDDNLRQGFGQFGYLYFVDIPFLFIGISIIISSLFLTPRRVNKIDLFFLLMLLAAPIPFALTRDSSSPHATRLILMLPSLLYFIARGFDTVISLLKSKVIKIILIFATFIIYGQAFFQFSHYYFLHYPLISARTWHTGMKEAVTNAVTSKGDSDVFFSNKYEPFLPFFLYYTRYQPVAKSCEPTSSIKSTNLDFFSGTVSENGYYFGQIDWGQIANFPQILSHSIFVIPKSELSAVQNSIGARYQLNIIHQVKKTYVEQEEFIIFSLK